MKSIKYALLAPLAFVFAFVITSSAQTYNAIWDFGPYLSADGSAPEGQIAMDSAGNIYGTTSEAGGIGDCGTVWELSPPTVAGGAWTETTIHTFSCTANGYYPLGGVTLDKQGNLYGTTAAGTHQGGTVFKMKPPTTSGGPWSYSNIHVFAASQGDGCGPQGPVTLDSSGNVYGTTSSGGAYSSGPCQDSGGIAFKLSTGSGGYKETILWSFGGAGDASYILSGLRSDANGNWYGTGYLGGAYGYGAVFELSPPASGGTAWTESVIYSFTGANSSTGDYPQGSLVIDSHGNLYGVAAGQSDTCCGAVFQMKPATGGGWTTKALYTFTKTTDGFEPIGLSMDSQAKNLYGVTMTTNGQSGNGVVFKLSQPTVSGGPWNYSVLHDFTTTGESGLKSPPLIDASGNVYGATFTGGPQDGRGVAYEITQ
jgi:hypothetical protein